MPLTTNVLRSPFAKVSTIGEPALQLVALRIALVDERAVVAERAPSSAASPDVQSRVNIVLAAGLTAVAKNPLPNASASPVRTLPTASTTGLFAAASAAAGGIGLKLFCAVIA